jgi:hypothetical protein
MCERGIELFGAIKSNGEQWNGKNNAREMTVMGMFEGIKALRL